MQSMTEYVLASISLLREAGMLIAGPPAVGTPGAEAELTSLGPHMETCGTLEETFTPST